MKRLIAGGLALLLALTLALSGTATLAEQMGTPSDIGGMQEESAATPVPEGESTATPVPEGESTATPVPEWESTATPVPEGESAATPVPEGESTDTPVPEGESAATPVPEGESTATPVPEEESTATPVPEATAEPALPTSGPAYFWQGDVQRFGELAELIPLAQDHPVYLASKEVYELPDYTLEQARSLRLALDPTVFPEEEDWVVMVSQTNPLGESAENTVYLWASLQLSLEGGSQEVSESILEMEVQVSSQDYDAQAPCTPTFTLTAIPALEAGQCYGVELDEGAPVALEGDTCTPTASGSYRFVVLNQAGEVLARSRAWTVTLAEKTAEGSAATPEAPAEATATPEAPVNGMLAASAGSTATPEAPAEATATPEAPVEATAAPEVTALPAPTAVLEPELLVTAVDYTPDSLSDAAPTFQLSGKTSEDWYYAVSVDDGAPLALVGDRYTATASGEYTLRFFLMDGEGQVLATSAPYPVRLDFTTESSIRKQAWMENPDGSGQRIYGTLEGLLATAGEGSQIYLLTGDIIVLSGSASQLSGVLLAPDPGVFSTGNYTVRAATVSPLDGSAGLFVYVDLVTEAGETQPLTVSAQCDQTLDGSWLTVAPTFALSCAEGLPEGYSWAVRYDGGAPVTIPGDTFTAGEEGDYILTFVVLDGAGQIAAATGDYRLRLDTTAPLVQAVAGESLTLTVTASDGVSGVDGLSLDGGASWYPPTDLGDGVWGLTFTAAEAYTFAPGTILARDGAGNLAAYQQEVTLRGSPQGNRGGFSGGYGGSSTSTVATTHASSDVTTVVAYDGVELVVADEVMSTLVMGETELELWLRPGEELTDRLGEDYQPAFTASLVSWVQGGETDTLVLAVTGEDLAQATQAAGEDGLDAAFTWDFNGAAYKTLAASGIDYLVLQVGDQVTALSTAGFAAGVRYTMYRAQGLSSQAFDYHVSMTETGETELSVTVAGETWTLTQEQDGEFYYYDVYTGTVEELAQARKG